MYCFDQYLLVFFFLFLMIRRPPDFTLIYTRFPYTMLCRSLAQPLLQIVVGGNRRRVEVRVRCVDAAFECFDHIVRSEVEEERHRIARDARAARIGRSEEHTSELQSLMRNSSAVF